jgi:hypothetical protein
MAACSLVFPVITGLVIATSGFEASILYSLKKFLLARKLSMTRLVSFGDKIIIPEGLLNAFNVHCKTGIIIGDGL